MTLWEHSDCKETGKHYTTLHQFSLIHTKLQWPQKKTQCLDKNFHTKFEGAVWIPKPFKILISKLGVLLHISFVMWLGDATEFFFFLEAFRHGQMVKSQKKIKIRPVASVLCGLQSEASDQWCQITWIIQSKEPMNPSLTRINGSLIWCTLIISKMNVPFHFRVAMLLIMPVYMEIEVFSLNCSSAGKGPFMG